MSGEKVLNLTSLSIPNRDLREADEEYVRKLELVNKWSKPGNRVELSICDDGSIRWDSIDDHEYFKNDGVKVKYEPTHRRVTVRMPKDLTLLVEKVEVW